MPTTNYNFYQYNESDIPSLIAGYNTGIEQVDNQLNAVQNMQTLDSKRITDLKKQVDQSETIYGVIGDPCPPVLYGDFANNYISIEDPQCYKYGKRCDINIVFYVENMESPMTDVQQTLVRIPDLLVPRESMIPLTTHIYNYGTVSETVPLIINGECLLRYRADVFDVTLQTNVIMSDCVIVVRGSYYAA